MRAVPVRRNRRLRLGGTLEAGKLAGLIVVDANPLEDFKEGVKGGEVVDGR